MKFDSMLPYILPSLGGCPDDLATRHLRLAAREFFERSCVWQESMEVGDTTATDSNYPLPLPDGAELVGLQSVAIDGEPVDEITTWKKGQAILRDQPESSYAWVIDKRDLGLYLPNQTAGLAIVAEAIFYPSLTANEVPDAYANQHLEAITFGALARLLALPRVPWQSVQDAAIQRTAFDDATATAAGQAGAGHSQGRLRVRQA